MSLTIDDLFSLIDWSGIEDDLRQEIEAAALAGVKNASVSIEDMPESTIREANAAAREWAKEHAADLVGRGEQSIAQTTRDAIREVITLSQDEETTAEDLIGRLQETGAF